jgi:indole-3-acetate monooxygenase
MVKTAHPSTVIDQEYTTLIRAQASAAEREGWLTRRQLELLHRERWFLLLAPLAYGGREYSLVDALLVEEALAWTDGSLGWVVTLCAGAGWFAAFFAPELATKIFATSELIFAGSGEVGGVATKRGDGYEISGKWRYATGAPVATIFTANCYVQERGVLLTDCVGNRLVAPFIFYRNEVNILKSWNAFGMCATGSHSFEAHKVWLPEERRFKIDENRPNVERPLYRVPFLQLAETTLAVNLSGMGLHFLEACEELFLEQSGGLAYRGIQPGTLIIQAKSRLNVARARLYQQVGEVWDTLCGGAQPEPTDLARLSRSARDIVSTVRWFTPLIYSLCGLRAADHGSPLNRAWRDIHTALQHGLFRKQM